MILHYIGLVTFNLMWVTVLRNEGYNIELINFNNAS